MTTNDQVREQNVKVRIKVLRAKRDKGQGGGRLETKAMRSCS